MGLLTGGGSKYAKGWRTGLRSGLAPRHSIGPTGSRTVGTLVRGNSLRKAEAECMHDTCDSY